MEQSLMLDLGQLGKNARKIVMELFLLLDGSQGKVSCCAPVQLGDGQQIWATAEIDFQENLLFLAKSRQITEFVGNNPIRALEICEDLLEEQGRLNFFASDWPGYEEFTRSVASHHQGLP
jgi:hypothetical protein